MQSAETWRWIWTYRGPLVAAGLTFAFVEAIVLARYRARDESAWTLKEALSNCFTLWLCQATRLVTFGFRLSVFVAVHAWGGRAIPTTVVSTALCYLGLDFLYYWKHRWLHETALGWSMHSVHHSSVELNLLTSIRSSWLQRTIDDFFYLPLALVGFDPLLVLITSDVNLYSQFWIHTRIIGRLGPLEWILNTPSSHRVHHARDRALANRNYGSTFIVWDRLFGTFTDEPEIEPRYGTELGFVGHDPLRIQLVGHLAWWRNLRKHREQGQEEHRG